VTCLGALKTHCSLLILKDKSAAESPRKEGPRLHAVQTRPFDMERVSQGFFVALFHRSSDRRRHGVPVWVWPWWLCCRSVPLFTLRPRVVSSDVFYCIVFVKPVVSITACFALSHSIWAILGDALSSYT
jgi:hypothetical protein